MAENYGHATYLLHAIFILIAFMSLVTASPQFECAYPCFPPPIAASDCPPALPLGSPPPPPPPLSPIYHYPPPPPPSGYYSPPDGYFPYFNPPAPEYGNYNNAPPPPNPILPYFPFYYKNPPPPEHSSAAFGVAALPVKRIVTLIILLHLCFSFS